MNSLSQMSFAQKLDMPPFWLAGFAAAAYLIAQFDPFATGFSSMGSMQWDGLVLLGLGAVLMVWSIRHMARAMTTVIPHLEPQHLVTDGPFGFSRNPIYLADALMLTGFIFLLGSLVALPVVAGFCVLIEIRFIRAEEARLLEGFAEGYAKWSTKTRRWL